jgi:hypothetical protein
MCMHKMTQKFVTVLLVRLHHMFGVRVSIFCAKILQATSGRWSKGYLLTAARHVAKQQNGDAKDDKGPLDMFRTRN